MKTLERGFTLIELMIVVTIISILAAVALPQYVNYTTRSKLSEMILAVANCRNTITDVVQSTKATNLPAASSWGCEVTPTTTPSNPVSKFVDTIDTSDSGVITVTTTADPALPIGARAKAITFTPFTDAGLATPLTNAGVGATVMGWRCASAIADAMPPQYLPTSCK